VTLQEPPPAPRRPRRRHVALGAVAALLLAVAVAVALLVHERAGEELPSRPPGLADYWDGRASLVLDRKWASSALGRPAGIYEGAHVEIADGTWYLFNRRREADSCAGQAGDFRRMGTEVRSSADRGMTWGPPTTILAPAPGTPWACAATDGDAVYDEQAGVWRYLFQCLGETPGWNGCYAERRSRSPLGAFAPPTPAASPVIPSGKLWSGICDDGDDKCARTPGGTPIKDEGTFNLFPADGGGWWVGFHGYDGTRGYRGIARTQTFRPGDWEVDGAAGTPTDAVLGPRDAAGWRESWRDGGPIGVGAASVLKEGAWYYQLAEAADVNLNCTPGQSWDLGLFRARRPGDPDWVQFPGGNPVVYSSRTAGPGGEARACNVEYPGLFRDPANGTTYLMHGRTSSDPAYDAIYVYRLEWDRNLLENGDLGRADANGWQPLQGTPAQLSVHRDPDGAPDGTPYLAFNCGAPTCDAGQSLYQDVDVPPDIEGDTVAFGGTFRAETGEGRLDVTAHQLDAAGRVISSTSVPVSAGASYARARGTLRLEDDARRLRFQLYPHTPGTLRADNLHVIPQDGCSGPRYPAC
jgi:hypothetical protein